MQCQSSLKCFQPFKWCLLKRSFYFNENFAWSATGLNNVIESLNLSKTNIIVGNLPLFYWRIFFKNSLIEFAPQRSFILLFSVCAVGDSIYPEVTRYTLKWWSKKTLSNYRYIEYRLNLSHISVHSQCLLPFNTKQSLKTFIFFSNALKM